MAARYLLLLFIISFASHCQGQPYRNLVFEGGGIRGIAYAGALKALEETGVTKDIERMAGTSVGAIAAGLMAVGYTADELKDIMEELKIQRFNDGKWFFIGGFGRMKRNYGWYRGAAMERWLGKLIAAKTGNADITLQELHRLSQDNDKYKDLYTVATNLSAQRALVLHYANYPNMPVKKAIRISISIPLYFGAVFMDSLGHTYKQQNREASYMVLADGGLVANYPISIFDTSGTNYETLGLKLERPEQIDYYKNGNGLAPYHINDLRTYIAALYNLTIEQLNHSNDVATEKLRTIYISTGNISPRIKKTTRAQKAVLYKNGKKAALDFLNRKQR